MRKKEKKKQAGQQWQVSFSDLLTLLLCFFVALIAFGNFKKIETGTAFADTNIVSDKIEPFLEREILLNTAELQENKLEIKYQKVKNSIKSKDFNITQVDLTTCGNKSVDFWQDSISNMKELESQLNDAIEGHYKIIYKLKGKNCELSLKEKESIARVNIVFKRIS